MSHLFTPLSLGRLPLANRIVVAPMCQYACADDGCANDWHVQHWGMLAQSGAGLLLTEATAVLPEGRISWADLGLYDDACEAAFAQALAGVRRWSPVPVGVQLAHAGRKASTHRPWEQGGRAIAPDAAHGWQVVAPSALPYAEQDPPPQALTATGIARVVQAFADAARRAARLGLEVIELHAAHGYLLHQFLSPLSNRRTDAYGGGLEHRMRLLLEVFDAVRAAVPEALPVGVRISATDWVDGGWDLAQSIALAKHLDARGCAYIHVSSGGLHPAQQIPLEPGYQLPFAQAIRREVAMPVIGVGLITTPAQAEAALAEGRADAIALARALLWNPRWPWHAAAELGATVATSPRFLRALPHGLPPLLVPATGTAD
ncbi:NADH:flavin oxidoreductase/NADH oxidase [Thermomonas alba]|uniref:NADH:flavin oxidoreductase/NADH oxidase n=1 Tax=Thermomonas alba TaxID=2888525 RepID=UPI001F034755|nr:NADH:flavin oxidoreductase/NADH oxidase [Thermomonas alba]